jgi:hypothetical protein
MKTKHLLSLVAACSFTFLVSGGLMAAKWRVNNMPQMYANFTNLQTAINTVAAGDTLLVEGSATSYGSLTISKSIVIFGPGYFLNENDSTQVNKQSVNLTHIIIQPTSSGTIIKGLNIISGGIDCISVQASNIIIQNCYMRSPSSNGADCIYISNSASGIQIIGCYIKAEFGGIGKYCIWNYNGSNISIFNNYIEGTSHQNVLIDSQNNSVVMNNILNYGQFVLSNTTFRNNILIYPNVFTLSGVITNNISNTGGIGNQNGNIESVDMNNVFVCYSNCSSYTLDERYRLKVGSVAIGAGYGGVDCGIFDGPYPYTISGLPNIPAIWEITNFGSSFLIKAKSH